MRRILTLLVAASLLVTGCSSGPSEGELAACDEWATAAQRREQVTYQPASTSARFTAAVLVAGESSAAAGGSLEELEGGAYEAGAEMMQLPPESRIPERGLVADRVLTEARQACIDLGAWRQCSGRWALTGPSTDEVCGT